MKVLTSDLFQQEESISDDGLEDLKKNMQHAQDCGGPAFNPLQAFYENAEYNTYTSYYNMTDVSIHC